MGPHTGPTGRRGSTRAVGADRPGHGPDGADGADRPGPDDTGPESGRRRGEGRRGKRSGDRGSGGGGFGGRRDGSADNADEVLADPEQAARNICLRLLTGQPRTRAELAAALQKRGIPAEAAESVLDRFGEVGLIDDAAFAEAWVSSRHRGRGLAGWALRQELYRRGIAAETVQDALGTLDDETQEETARSLVRRRLAATRSLAPDVRTRRLLGMLARKGYPAGTAARVIREEIGAELSGPAGESLSEALEALADEPE